MTGGMSRHNTLRGPASENASGYTKRSRILLVDDHPLLRLGLRTLISKDSSLQVVAECEDARSAISHQREEP
jgi:CheY-like chemotaxis protein